MWTPWKRSVRKTPLDECLPAAVHACAIDYLQLNREYGHTIPMGRHLTNCVSGLSAAAVRMSRAGGAVAFESATEAPISVSRRRTEALPTRGCSTHCVQTSPPRRFADPIFLPTAARTDACHGRGSRQEFPDRQRRYCYGCSVNSLSTGLYPETLSWALKDVLKGADIPEARLEVRSGDWRIPRGLSHGIPR